MPRRKATAANAIAMGNCKLDGVMDTTGDAGDRDDGGVRLRGGAKTTRRAKAKMAGSKGKSAKSTKKARKTHVAANGMATADAEEVQDENDDAEEKKKKQIRRLSQLLRYIDREETELEQLRHSSLDDPTLLSKITKLEGKLRRKRRKLGNLEDQGVVVDSQEFKAEQERFATTVLRSTHDTEVKLSDLRRSDVNNSKIVAEIQILENKLAKQVRTLRQLETRGAVDLRSEFGAEIKPLSGHEETNSEKEVTGDDRVQNPRKRRFSDVGFEDDKDNGNNSITEGFIVIDDTPNEIKKEKKVKEEKKEKKDKNNKKRKIDNSQDTSQVLKDIPDFEGQLLENSTVTTVSTRIKAKHAMQDEAEPPTPEQAKRTALIDTITRQRDRSESVGAGRIYKALLASIGAPSSPPSPSPFLAELADEQHDALIEIGKMAIAAPVLPSKQKPIRDRAFVAQPSIVKDALTIPHRESPILPPKRNFTLKAKAPPVAEDFQVEKPKTKKKKDFEGKKARGEKATEGSQESQTLSQTVTALKEATSASIMEGVFSQADPFISTGSSTTTTILPPVKPSAPKVLSHLVNIQSSTPITTPTKPKKTQRNKRMLGEMEEWEIEPGRVRARVSKDNSDDDVETEENIAFSSSYISARPLGISISNMKFQILTIISGTDQELATTNSTEKEGIKICSVAKGRVKVVLGNKKFTIGEGGMWRVRNGEKCVVANQSSSEPVACVHIFAVEDEGSCE